MRGLRTLRRAEYAELVALFFLYGVASGMWLVPLSTILDAQGLHRIKPFAFACTATAAFVSPLIFGAMADRHASPVKVLRGLGLATAAASAVAAWSIARHWNGWLVLGLIQLYSLCAAPASSILASVAFERLADASKEFGPIRAMTTFGWMVGCWVVSLLRADTSAWVGVYAGISWLALAAFTPFLPELEIPKAVAHLTWHERLGFDALKLLKNRDHRVVFITTALFAIPLAAFYPYAPPHMRDLGLQRTSAWMTLGQVTEIISMFSLGTLLLKWRLKWIFCLGLAFGVLRFALSALNSKLWLLTGVFLHGLSYTTVFVTAQIYLEQRVDPAWRVRAQALLTLMNTGVGNLIGYLSTGLWFSICTDPAGTRWTLFWSGLVVAVALVMAYFLAAYRGVGEGFFRSRAESDGGD
jgi:MFS family permease